MTTFARLSLFALTPLLLAACSRESMMTDTVVVQTSQGPITCQLYDRGIVLWDEAVSRPAGLSKEDADAACKAEGRRDRT